MFYQNAVQASHDILQKRIKPGMCVVDATLGKGFDAQMMLSIIGQTGKLYGFDLDPRAIDHTQERLKDMAAAEVAQLYVMNHAEATTVIEGEIDAVVFNLGYLPAYSKTHITKTDTTLKAVTAFLSRLSIGGCLIAVVYPGHPEGALESIALNQYVSELDQKQYHVFSIQYPNQINHPPYLIYIERRY